MEPAIHDDAPETEAEEPEAITGDENEFKLIAGQHLHCADGPLYPLPRWSWSEDE